MFHPPRHLNGLARTGSGRIVFDRKGNERSVAGAAAYARDFTAITALFGTLYGWFVLGAALTS